MLARVRCILYFPTTTSLNSQIRPEGFAHKRYNFRSIWGPKFDLLWLFSSVRFICALFLFLCLCGKIPNRASSTSCGDRIFFVNTKSLAVYRSWGDLEGNNNFFGMRKSIQHKINLDHKIKINIIFAKNLLVRTHIIVKIIVQGPSEVQYVLSVPGYIMFVHSSFHLLDA